jgi:O-antigen/teichoic acid export membrane protein
MVKKLALSVTPEFIKDIYVKYYKNNELTNRFANILSLDILVKGGMFFFYPIYIRLMTVDEYGVYGYLINIIAVFSMALNFGMNVAQTKQYHDLSVENRGSYIFSINAFLALAVTIVTAILFSTHLDSWVISFLFEKSIDYQLYRPWIILGIVNSIYSLMVYNYFMTSEQIKYYQWQNLLKLILVNTIVIAYLKSDIGDNVLVRIKYNYIVETLILVPFLIMYLRGIQFRFNAEYVKSALYIGLPAMFSGIIGVFYSLADRKFIEQYRSHEELGVYTLGITLSGIIYLIFAAFQNSLLPFFFKEKNKVVNYERTIRSTKKITGLLLLMALLMFVFTYLLIKLEVIKPEYAAILPIMPLMLFTQIIQSVSTLFSNYYIYFNKSYYSIFLTILSAVLNIVLCIIFIPDYGIFGAVAATFVVSVVLCIINYNFARKKCLGN